MLPLMLYGAFKTSDSSLYVNLDKATNAFRFTSKTYIISLLFLGIIASGSCFVMFNKACNIVGTVRANIFLYLIPLVTILVAFIVLGEKISLMGFIGAICTILGLFISGIKKVRPKKQ